MCDSDLKEIWKKPAVDVTGVLALLDWLPLSHLGPFGQDLRGEGDELLHRRPLEETEVALKEEKQEIFGKTIIFEW